MKKILLTFLIVIILVSCSNKEPSLQNTDVTDTFRNSYTSLREDKKILDETALSAYYETLTDAEKVGQLFLISVDGKSSKDAEFIESLNKTAPGGYILFSFNITESADEMIDFLAALNNEFIENGLIPPYISIDHEGGMVNRLRSICSKLPSQLKVAEKFTQQEAQKLYELHGTQLKCLGITVNLAPVVEVLTEDNALFLEDRSYGGMSDVLTYSNAQITGMKKAGVLPVLKHFPGNTNNDPHTGLPVLRCDLDELKSAFMRPFEMESNGTTGILVAHTVIPAVDEKPACLSEKIIHLLFENNSPTENLLFSDDLLMTALMKNGYPIQRSLIDAINAGINVLMIANVRFDEYADIILEEYRNNSSFRNKVDDSVKKILRWKAESGILERTYTQTGFFEYDEVLHLPEKTDETAINKRKQLFKDAYVEATALYNDIWWSK